MPLRYKIGQVSVGLSDAPGVHLRDVAYGINMMVYLVCEDLPKIVIHAKEYTVSKSLDIEKMVDITEDRCVKAMVTLLDALGFSLDRIIEKIPEREKIKEEIVKTIEYHNRRGR